MSFGPLVDGEWLAEHHDSVRIVDVRWYLGGPPGWDGYVEGHIPGAVFLDVDTDLSAPATAAAGRHPLPSPAQFAAALGRVGIADGQPVVAYDDRGGSTASRLWWLLHVLGEPVAVLDGGLAAWRSELSREVPLFAPVERQPRLWPAEAFVDADTVATTVLPVLDARTADRYERGDPAVDPRPGHIPGARNAPWAANLDSGTGRFLPPEALRAAYAARGVTDAAIAYCGSGVTACHDLLALTIAGVPDLRLYAGSWSQWAADPDRPAEPGA
ncbi:MAG: thiosulfate/3-mercaptopyruvate sulfurtransferase [Pseudonocardiales bacterium]|jgi:thiosulfate/3-mercaptopyruvate sulfurtransferase|nr:thiosulfate/3-mercaptopyruvate sulfurtransferase [Pseudonocardiales bacterium]